MALILDTIENQFLAAQADAIRRFNEDADRFVKDELRARRDGLLQAREYLDGLRIPIYGRPDAPRTFAAPGIERKATPRVDKRVSNQPLEPVLVEVFYEHIVGVIAAMSRGMERNPGDYASWEEEQLGMLSS